MNLPPKKRLEDILVPKHRYTVEQYLGFEHCADRRHEYVDGDILAMVGANENHVLITSNLISDLVSQLKNRRYRVYASQMRLKVSSTEFYTYPDVMVVCGEPRFERILGDTLLNPNVIVEVLSPATEEYDRITKFRHYCTLDSFIDYLLIAQDVHQVEHRARQSDGEWVRSEYRGLQAVVPLRSIGCELRLDEVYREVAINS